jgi:putative FmdB family regulatory protein
MPVYEYHCRQCGRVFGRLFRTLKAAEAGDVPPCPACGGSDVQRLISTIAVLSGAESRAGESGETATESRPKELFGRKELEQAIKDRGY